MATKLSLSETLQWHARAGQARRIGVMLSPRDSALLEAYAKECEDRAHAASVAGTRAAASHLIDIQRRDDRAFGSTVKGLLASRAA